MTNEDVVLMNDEDSAAGGPETETPDALTDGRRRELFAALVAAQDRKMGVRASREAVAAQFGVDYETVCEVEDEGLDANWPPFGKG